MDRLLHSLRIVAVICFVTFLTGCATTKPVFHVFVDSINSNEATLGKTCIVLSGLKDVRSEDLQFKEYVSYVERALTSKGYVVVDQIENANIVVFLGYGIGDPEEHTYAYSLPIWGQTGFSSATTFGTGNTLGSAYPYGGNTGLSGTTIHSGTTAYTPTHGVIGATTHQDSFVTYTKYVFLNAYDLDLFRESKKEKQLWKTEMVSTGSGSDLRRVFPVLVAASSPYIGENTGHKLEIVLKEDSKEVLEIKGINEE